MTWTCVVEGPRVVCAAGAVVAIELSVVLPPAFTLVVWTTCDVSTVCVFVVVCFCFCVVVVVGLSVVVAAGVEVSVADELSLFPPAGKALTPTSKIASERRNRRRCISRFLRE